MGDDGPGADEWHHIACSWDENWAAQRGEIYFDGNDVTDTVVNNLSIAAAIWDPASTFDFGRSSWNINDEGDAIFDNVKVWDIALTTFEDRWIEGFGGQHLRSWRNPGLPEPEQVIEPIVCAVAKPQVLLMGVDLYALGYVRDIFKISEYKTFQRDKLIQNSYELTCKNFDDFFSIGNPASLFSGTNWIYETLTIKDESGEEIWRGVIQDIRRDHDTKLAIIESKNSLVKYMDTVIEYESSDWETAADAAKNIMDAYDYTDYNNASFVRSAAILTAASCYIKVNVKLADNVTLQQILEKLAEFGAADIYSHAGNVYYNTWQAFTGGVKVSLAESDLLDAPSVRTMLNEMRNDYKIGYSGTETYVTDETAGNIGNISRLKYGTHTLPEMGGSSEEQIIMKDAVSARFLGETHIKRTHLDYDNANCRPIQEINFTLPLKHQEWIDLTTYFRLTLSDENWTNKLFEVAYFERDPNMDRISMTAWEVQE